MVKEKAKALGVIVDKADSKEKIADAIFKKLRLWIKRILKKK